MALCGTAGGDAGWNAYRDDQFTTSAIGPSEAWGKFLFQTPNLAVTDYDATNTAWVARVWANASRVRYTGIVSNQPAWMPYSHIGTDSYVRAKFYIWRGGEQSPGDTNQTPNFRIRVSNRFAVTSLLEVFHHLNLDPANAALMRDLRPSGDPENPSMYRVDFDAVDVPALVNNPAVEGASRAFEAYALEPQENGLLGLTECAIGAYPAALLPDSTSSAVLRKVYAPSSSDAGDLRVVKSTDLSITNWILGTFEGDPITPDPSGSMKGTYAEAGMESVTTAPGVTLDAALVDVTRVGVVSRDFDPGTDYAAPSHVRVEPGMQVKVRFHLTSTQMSNRNAQIRMRARSVKWAYSMKYEVGGAWAAGAANNAVAQQALPGIGCANPDKDGSEDGGWYTLLLATPLAPEIRPEFAAGTPVEARMPGIAGEPGPGVDAPSRRDLKLGLDLLDTITANPNAVNEVGNVTCDRIEVRVHPAVQD